MPPARPATAPHRAWLGRSPLYGGGMARVVRPFEVSLHVVHPDVDPESITAALGVAPKIQYRAGDRRRRLDGKLLDGVYSRSHWVHSMDLSGVTDLVSFLEELLRRLEIHGELFKRISASGGRTELFCGIYAESGWDEVIPHRLFAGLGELKVDLRLDGYPKAHEKADRPPFPSSKPGAQPSRREQNPA